MSGNTLIPVSDALRAYLDAPEPVDEGGFMLRGDGFWEERFKTIGARYGMCTDRVEVWALCKAIQEEMERWAIDEHRAAVRTLTEERHAQQPTSQVPTATQEGAPNGQE